MRWLSRPRSACGDRGANRYQRSPVTRLEDLDLGGQQGGGGAGIHPSRTASYLATERGVFRSECVLRRDDLLDARATCRSVVVQEASAGLGRSRARP